MTLLGGMTFVQLLLQQRVRLAEAKARGRFPFAVLTPGRVSLGGVGFSWNGECPTAPDCDLTLRANDTGSGVCLDWEYNREVYADSTIARWQEHLETLVHSAAQQPATEIRRLPLLSQGQGERMLVEWNATAAAYPTDLCAYELIEQQCRRTPQAVAAQFNGVTLSYQEMDERANQLAHHLGKAE